MRETITRKREKVDPNWKERLSRTMIDCGLVDRSFTGRLSMSVLSGGVACFTKEETLR